MSHLWSDIATTWATETQQWNTLPIEYSYAGTLVGIFGASNTTLIEYLSPSTGCVAIFGVASAATQNNEALYTGSVLAIMGVAMGDFDLLTWTPQDEGTNTWVEEASL